MNFLKCILTAFVVGILGFIAGRGQVSSDKSSFVVQETKIDTTLAPYYDWGFGACVKDERVLYALLPVWMTTDALVALEYDGPSARFVSDADSVYLIASGQHTGKLIVSKHKYTKDEDGGSYDRYFMIDKNGKELMEFGEERPDFEYVTEPCR